MFELCLSSKKLAGRAVEKEVIVCFTIPESIRYLLAKGQIWGNICRFVGRYI